MLKLCQNSEWKRFLWKIQAEGARTIHCRWVKSRVSATKAKSSLDSAATQIKPFSSLHRRRCFRHKTQNWPDLRSRTMNWLILRPRITLDCARWWASRRASEAGAAGLRGEIRRNTTQTDMQALMTVSEVMCESYLRPSGSRFRVWKVGRFWTAVWAL